jgi:hypothetical protein
MIRPHGQTPARPDEELKNLIKLKIKLMLFINANNCDVPRQRGTFKYLGLNPYKNIFF